MLVGLGLEPAHLGSDEVMSPQLAAQVSDSVQLQEDDDWANYGSCPVQLVSYGGGRPRREA